MLLRLRQTALRERDELDQLATDLGDMYRRAEQQLRDRLVAQVRKGLKESPEDVAAALQLAELRRAAEQQASALSRLAPERVEKVMERARTLGASAALNDIAEATGERSLAAAPRPNGGSRWVGEDGRQSMTTVRGRLSSLPAAVSLTASLQSRLEDVGRRILRWPDDVYRRAVAISAQSILLGGGTQATAQRAAWQRLTDEGVKGFTDARGRQWNLGTYVETATRTATRRAWDEQHTDTMEAAGISLVTIAVGNGACKACSDAGGKVFRLDSGPTGRVKVESSIEPGKMITVKIDGTLDDLRSHGWRHPNCRCRQIAFLPGLSAVSDETTYDPQAEADRQRLRELERQVREAKSAASQAVSPAAAADARARVRALQAKIREHTEATGLARQPRREAINLGNKAKPVAPTPPPAPLPKLPKTQKYLVDDLREQAQQLDDEDQSVLVNYVQFGNFEPVNNALRGVDTGTGTDEFFAGDMSPEQLAYERDSLNDVINKSRAMSTLTLYRGVDQDGFVPAVGKTFTDPGFMSTTLDPKVAFDFGTTVMKIEYGTGRPALFVDALDEISLDQQEVLLPTGVKLKVTKIVEAEGKRIVYAKAV